MPFNDVPDPEMVAKSAALAAAFTPARYSYLLSLLPTPESYNEMHNRFEASYMASLKGDPEKVKACEADRLELNKGISIIAGLAKALTVKDPTILEILTLSHLKAAVTMTELTEPRNLKFIFNQKGQLTGSFGRVERAKGYQIWACDSDPTIEANWRLLTSSTTCKGIIITGLTRGKINSLRVRAMRNKLVGPWSHIVTVPG